MTRMTLRPEVSWQRQGDEAGFLVDVRTGSIFGLNRTAAFLLERLAGGDSREDLVRALTERFEVEELAAGQDTDAFLALLKEHDLVR